MNDQLSLIPASAAPSGELWALTLTQPWATLVALREKRWETRGWPTKRRGRIAIHAAKGFPRLAREMFLDEFFSEVLARHGFRRPGDLPTGKILGVCDIVSCQPTWAASRKIDRQEWLFGNYGPGRFAFELGGIFALPEPVETSGALSFWRVPDEAAKAVLSQVPVGGAHQ